jgi:hypothetical protein
MTTAGEIIGIGGIHEKFKDILYESEEQLLYQQRYCNNE